MATVRNRSRSQLRWGTSVELYEAQPDLLSGGALQLFKLPHKLSKELPSPIYLVQNLF